MSANLKCVIVCSTLMFILVKMQTQNTTLIDCIPIQIVSFQFLKNRLRYMIELLFSSPPITPITLPTTVIPVIRLL